MKIGSTYKFVIDVTGKVLTFTGKIIFEDETFITFEDKFGIPLTYNKSKIISMEELQ